MSTSGNRLNSMDFFYRHKRKLSRLKVVSGILTTAAREPVSDDSETQQWRSVGRIYSQKFYRFPAYNLCILVCKGPTMELEVYATSWQTV